MSAKKKVLKVVMISLAVFVGFATVGFAAYYVYEHREELPFFGGDEEITEKAATDADEDTDRGDAETAANVDPDDLEWIEFYNVDKNFRFEYPRSWYVYSNALNPPPPATTFVANIPEDEHEAYSEYASFNVYAMGDPMGQTLDDHGEILLLLDDGYSETEMTISGLRAVRLERRSHHMDTGASIYTIYDGNLYRIGFGGTSIAVFEANEDVLERMLDSFYFVDDEGNPVGDESGDAFWSGEIYIGPVESGNTTLLQNEVDTGSTPWRLDPVLVARTRGPEFGFDEGDEYSLIQQYVSDIYDLNVAEVEVVHMSTGDSYTISLKQPETQGSRGIWVIYWVAETE